MFRHASPFTYLPSKQSAVLITENAVQEPTTWSFDFAALEWELFPFAPSGIAGCLLTINDDTLLLYGGSPIGPENVFTASFYTEATGWQDLNLADSGPPFVGGNCFLFPVLPILFIFGAGLDTVRAGDPAIPGNLHYVGLACGPGQFGATGYLLGGCKLCPQGTFTPNRGSTACLKCPGQVITASEGASSIEDCSVCVPGTCHHGECSVASGFTVNCRCDAAYQGSKFCEYPVYPLLGTGLAMLVVAVVFVISKKAIRRVNWHKSYAELQEQLLLETQEEVHILQRSDTCHGMWAVGSQFIEHG